jgi:hypothetical protein
MTEGTEKAARQSNMNRLFEVTRALSVTQDEELGG